MNSLRQYLEGSPHWAGNGTAIVEPADGLKLTYKELANRVTAFARQLEQHCTKKGVPVAIYCDKSSRNVIGVLATLFAGCGYVPLDAHSTVERNSRICGDCRPPLMLLQDDIAAELLEALDCAWQRFPAVEAGLSLLVLDWTEPAPTLADDLAIVLYTSGSTGAPKGVQLTHANVLAFLRWCSEALPLPDQAVCASIAPFHFDLSLFDLYVSLVQGWSIVLCDYKATQNPRMMVQLLQQQRVNVCYATPTLLTLLARHGRMDRADLRALGLVLFAGEVFNPGALTELRRQLPDACMYNLYGPTETNVITAFRLPPEIELARDEPYPVGRPCAHASALLWRDDGVIELQPGAWGELLVAGPSVFPGYLGGGQPGGRVFLQHCDGSNYYFTGDRVQVDEAGDLRFVCRVDRMVKRRGYRIQLEEVEQAILSHPGVSAVSLACAGVAGEPVLCAFWTATGDVGKPAEADLRQHCLERLPAYFLPDSFQQLATMPVTSSGKIDHQAIAREFRDGL